MTGFTADDVLRACDDAADESVFPMLDNGYYYPVDVRLHAFADAERWLLLIETVGYNERNESLIDVVTSIGTVNGEAPEADVPGFIDRLDNHDDLVGEDGDLMIRVGAPPAVVRGHALPTPRTPGRRVEEFCRELVPEHRELLLMSPDELDRFRPADLPLILRLDEWRHPDLLNGEMPSENDAFQRIALALTRRDPTCYRPTEAPNTHWSHWPDGGSL